jgi:hypothetical protein
VPPIHVSRQVIRGAEPPTRYDGATLDVHYPVPLRSDTLCRKLVDASVGETNPPERSRALSELTQDFSVRRGPAFAKPAAA